MISRSSAAKSTKKFLQLFHTTSSPTAFVNSSKRLSSSSTSFINNHSTSYRSFHSKNSILLDNSSPTLNKIRYNYSIECEKLVNEQINHELNASYFYTALATYFAQPTVALPGVATYFYNQSNEERSHAQSLINYQNSRGGKVQFAPISAPPEFAKLFETNESSSADQLHMATKGFELAIETERMVYDKISHLYHRAEQQKDFALTGYLQKLIDEQVDSLRELQTLLTKSKRIVNDYWFDQLLSAENLASTSTGSSTTNTSSY